MEIYLALLSLLLTVALAFLGWLWSVLREERRERMRIVSKLADFELYVARNYASVAYLKDVESRFSLSVDRVIGHLEKLEGKFDDLRKTLIETSSNRHTST